MTTPLWQQIRDTLTDEIAERRFQPGDRLPTEARLALRFGVNRHTVRRALGAMQDAGLVTARRGAGVFVARQPVPYRLGSRTRFTQNLAETGHTGTRRILRLDTVPSGALEARHLGLAPRAPVHVLDNVALIDDVPVAYSHCVFPAALLPEFPAAMRKTLSITKAFSACGITDYRRDWTRLTAERASGAAARHLGLNDGAPVITALSLNRALTGRQAIEFARTQFVGGHVELLIDASS